MGSNSKSRLVSWAAKAMASRYCRMASWGGVSLFVSLNSPRRVNKRSFGLGDRKAGGEQHHCMPRMPGRAPIRPVWPQ
jgi:hypothetical protein